MATNLQELIKTCRIEDGGDGNLRIWNKTQGAKRLDEIKAHKAEILAYFAAERTAVETARIDRQAKIDAIEGLKEIKNAIDAAQRYTRAFERMMADENNDGANPPSKPKTDVAALMTQYPVAAAYLQAESYANSSHFVQAAAGRKALERIINGEAHAEVLATMQAEWNAHLDKAMWD